MNNLFKYATLPGNELICFAEKFIGLTDPYQLSVADIKQFSTEAQAKIELYKQHYLAEVQHDLLFSLIQCEELRDRAFMSLCAFCESISSGPRNESALAADRILFVLRRQCWNVLFKSTRVKSYAYTKAITAIKQYHNDDLQLIHADGLLDSLAEAQAEYEHGLMELESSCLEQQSPDIRPQLIDAINNLIFCIYLNRNKNLNSELWALTDSLRELTMIALSECSCHEMI